MARIQTKPRNFRATDAQWEGAMDAAARADVNLPDVLRDFLDWYRRKPGARMPVRPPEAPDSTD